MTGLKPSVPTGMVMLRNGPMNGWVVRKDAPALQPDWANLAAEEGHEHDFHYQVTKAGDSAYWKRSTPPAPVSPSPAG